MVIIILDDGLEVMYAGPSTDDAIALLELLGPAPEYKPRSPEEKRAVQRWYQAAGVTVPVKWWDRK
jgi:hypothetical protein